MLRPSARPEPRPWSGSSSPGRRSAPGRPNGSVALSPRRRPRRSRRTPSASGRKRWAASRVHRRAWRWAHSPADAASGWRPFLPACNASVASSCVLSFTLLGERLLHFHLNRNRMYYLKRAIVAQLGLGRRSLVALGMPVDIMIVLACPIVGEFREFLQRNILHVVKDHVPDGA